MQFLPCARMVRLFYPMKIKTISTVWKCCLLLLTVALNTIDSFAQSDTTMNLENTNRKLITAGAGYLTAGYQYGLTPYAMMDSTVGGFFSIEGNQQVNIASAPINISGRYSTLRNVTGLNNSIHVSFDAAAYKEQLRQRAKQKAVSYKDSIVNMQSLEQKYTQRLYYLQYLNTLSPEQYKKKFPQQPALPGVDSLQPNIPKTDSLVPDVQVPKYALPSLSLPTGEGYKDSLSTIIEQQRMLLDSIRNVRSRFEKLQHLTDSISAMKNGELPSAGQLPWLSRVRSFEAGLCYPMLSPFSLYGIPLRGFVTEVETGKMYFAASAGKTISNLMFTQSLLENNISNARNLYNFFDFTNVESGRTVAAVRVGAGQKDGNHIIAGLLWGKGLQSYWQDSSVTLNTAETEQNVVADIDASFRLGKIHQFSFNYAKSVIRNTNTAIENDTSGQPRLTDPGYRSHAAQVKYTGVIPWTHTGVSATVRWIDPYFRSYGSGFVRPDNVRFEIKAEQSLGKKWKLQLMYRQEQNNLLGLYNDVTLLRSGGVSLQFKGSSRFQCRVLYQPVVQQVSGDTLVFRNDNQMVNTSFTWRPKTGKWRTTITGVGSYYKLLDGVANREYTNTLFIARTQSKKGWMFGANYSLYTISPDDSLYTDNGIAMIESGYTTKKGWSIIGGYKFGHFSDGHTESGFMAQGTVPLWKNASLVIEGQRLIRGDFYNMYSKELFDSFPYLLSTRLQLTW